MVYDTNYISECNQQLSRAKDKKNKLEKLYRRASGEFEVACLNAFTDMLGFREDLPKGYTGNVYDFKGAYSLPEYAKNIIDPLEVMRLIETANPYFKRYGIIVRGLDVIS